MATAIISESVVVLKSQPRCSRVRRNSNVLTRLPLCASAKYPRRVDKTAGWALALWLDPVVE